MSAPLRKLLAAFASDPPDAELLARFVANHDEAAFAGLVRRHGPAVHRICRRLLGSSSADDAFQATFLVLACRAKSVRNAASVGSWLIGVAGRVARQMRKQALRGRSQSLDELASEPPARESTRSPEIDELGAILDDELTRLPETLRDPLVLCVVEGRTQEQAVIALGVSIRTVRRRLDRAKALLRLRLERRGVIPAVAAGLVASVGPASAVAPELARRTVQGVSDFLTGVGVSTTAVVVAKGVMGSMVTIKVSALVAATAAVMIGLGAIGAGEEPAAVPTQPVPAPSRPFTPPAGPVSQNPQVNKDGLIATYRTTNFVVTGYKPNGIDPVLARAIANELEYQRKVIAERWLGKELKPWPQPCEAECEVITGDDPRPYKTHPGIWSQVEKFDKEGIAASRMQLQGPLDTLLWVAIPFAVADLVVRDSFGDKGVPQWGVLGVGWVSTPLSYQSHSDEWLRQPLLRQGNALRLKSLFRIIGNEQNNAESSTQGHALTRFLLTREVKLKEMSPQRALIEFMRHGMQGNTIESWDKAAKMIYGLASVDELEAVWLDWLKKPEGQLIAKQVAAPRAAEKKEQNLEFIPPVDTLQNGPLLAAAPRADAGENILQNGGAEEGDTTPTGWSQGAEIDGVEYLWDKTNGQKGKASLCLHKTAERYFPIAQWYQVVDRTGDLATLQVSAQVKADGVTKAVIDVAFLDDKGVVVGHKWATYIGAKEAGDKPVTHDWKEYSGRVELPAGVKKIQVGLQVYGPGKVWFDEVRAEYVK